MQEKENQASMLMKASAFLSRNPGERYSVEQVAEAIGTYYQAVQGALYRLQATGKISVDKVRPRQVVYYATPEQADAIQKEIREIAISFLRLVGEDADEVAIPPKAPAAAPPIVRRAAKPGPATTPAVLRLLDPATVSNRLHYLQRLRDNTVFGQEVGLKLVIADYEATLARARSAG